MVHDPTRRRFVVGLLGAASLGRVHAESKFPDRAVRIVVPYSVGIGPDVVARAVAERLSMQWGQPVIVDNKPGASGIIAFAEVRRTAPDGYTLFLADTATLAVNPLIHAELPYDPARDLVPLSLLFRTTFLVYVGGDSRFRSIAGLLQEARSEPKRVSYASLGNGHASQVAIESMARAANVDLLHVPFKEAGAMLSAVASGDVDFTAIGTNTASGLVALGKLRPLAVAANSRIKAVPDVPTLLEAGGPAVEMRPWAALVAVAGTPQSVLQILRAGILAALDSPDARRRVESAGFELTPSTPQELEARVAADIANYAPLVREGRVTRY
ncbi:MAG TPA: tripartite tricarboxylate transporter substrate binding protein [Casimicrobiaceae bacterium]|nr:tripartite tricarboxylate transporter substrate binding protein [Casimicrobiaceae bacterium]